MGKGFINLSNLKTTINEEENSKPGFLQNKGQSNNIPLNQRPDLKPNTQNKPSGFVPGVFMNQQQQQ